MIRSALPRTFFSWLPLLLLTAAALPFAAVLPPWGFMWVIAAAQWLGFKALSVSRIRPPTLWRGFCYWLLWPGMDAEGFLHSNRHPPPPQAREWFTAGLKTSLGAALLWGVVPQLLGAHPLLVAWLGWLALGLLAHFGILHLLALLWQRAGVAAQPIHDAPIRAASVREFWGQRWNRAFRDVVEPSLFRPLARKLGLTGAMALTFLFSGVLHELVISLPAGAGYGLPTAYFLLQGVLVAVERTPGFRNRWLLVLGTWLPVVILFHPPFLLRVVLPFLEVIGAR